VVKVWATSCWKTPAHDAASVRNNATGDLSIDMPFEDSQ